MLSWNSVSNDILQTFQYPERFISTSIYQNSFVEFIGMEIQVNLQAQFLYTICKVKVLGNFWSGKWVCFMGTGVDSFFPPPEENCISNFCQCWKRVILNRLFWDMVVSRGFGVRPKGDLCSFCRKTICITVGGEKDVTMVYRQHKGGRKILHGGFFPLRGGVTPQFR